MVKFIFATIVLALFLLTLIVWRLLRDLSPAAVTFLIASILAVIVLLGLFLFVLTLVALLTPNPTYGPATPQAPPVIYQTFIIINPVQREQPYTVLDIAHPELDHVLSDPHRPAPQPTPLLPDRRRPHHPG